MIETIEDCYDFASHCSGDWIVHVVSQDETVHPANTIPSILFIKVISTGKTYYYSFNHPDSIPTISPDEFVGTWLMKYPNVKWALDKKLFDQHITLPNVFDANVCGFLSKNEILTLSDYETPAHNLIRQHIRNVKPINQIVPLMKHLELFEDMCESIQKIIYPVDDVLLNINNNILTPLGVMEKAGIFVDAEKFAQQFKVLPNKHGLIFSQYNFYTSTGRPSNRFGGINFAALNTKDNSRECFVSRYGNDGRMIVIDYSAFHPRIICDLTKYKMGIDVNIYEYLAKLYFQKKDIDEIDLAEAKKLTFRQLYGGVEDKYAHIKYLSNLKTFIAAEWDFFKKNGYVFTPIFKRRITDNHIKDPNPEKVFNYILQAVEGEIAIPQINNIQSFLGNKQTKAILYTYDSILYDFYKGDGVETLNEIKSIMSINGQYPIKTYIGKSYKSVQQILF